MIKENSDRDFRNFVNFNEHRKLYKVTKELYALHYVIYDFLSILVEPKYSLYSSLAKRDLVSGLDSLTRGNFISLKRDYRSFIESSIRILAVSYREYIVLKRKSRGIYVSSLQLRELRSLIDTHKIGKFTSGILSKVENSIIYDDVNKVNNIYSQLSRYVHTNENIKNDIAKDLISLVKHSEAEFNEVSEEVYEILSYTSLILYCAVCLAGCDSCISQQNLYYYIKLLKKYEPISENHVFDISNKLNTFLIDYSVN